MSMIQTIIYDLRNIYWFVMIPQIKSGDLPWDFYIGSDSAANVMVIQM